MTEQATDGGTSRPAVLLHPGDDHDLPLPSGCGMRREDLHGIRPGTATVTATGGQFLGPDLVKKGLQRGRGGTFDHVTGKVEEAHHRVEVTVGLGSEGAAAQGLALQ